VLTFGRGGYKAARDTERGSRSATGTEYHWRVLPVKLPVAHDVSRQARIGIDRALLSKKVRARTLRDEFGCGVGFVRETVVRPGPVPSRLDRLQTLLAKGEIEVGQVGGRAARVLEVDEAGAV
jgi:hypothetical protein